MQTIYFILSLELLWRGLEHWR